MSSTTVDIPVQLPTNVVAGERPVITEPLDGMAVDADYATFTWTSVIGADGYALQVARDEAFTDLVVDVSVGNATMLTLFEAFRPDGQPRYARVSAIINSTDQPPSDVVTFRPLSDDEFDAQNLRPKRRQDGPITSAPKAAASAQSGDDVLIPYRMSGSSDAMAYAVVAVGLGMFALLILVALLA
jgi:hypothetical protein